MSPASAVATPKVECEALLTPEEADEALGEFVTGILDSPGVCQWETDSGAYLRFELGSAEDFLLGEIEAVAGEAVAGIGDEALWFSGVQRESHISSEETVTLGILSVRLSLDQGDFYFRIILNLPQADSSAQLETAKGLAVKAIGPLQ